MYSTKVSKPHIKVVGGLDTCLNNQSSDACKNDSIIPINVVDEWEPVSPTNNIKDIDFGMSRLVLDLHPNLSILQ